MTDPGPYGPSHRRFSVGDAMILTAAVAAAITLDRRAPLALLEALDQFDLSRAGGWVRAIYRLRNPLNRVALPILIFATPAWLLMRIRRPRPPRDRILRQPGFIACGVASLAVAGLFAGITIFRMSGFAPGVMVAGSWIAMRIARRWEPEREWVDRSGRVLGVLWIATLPWFFWLAWW